MKMNKIKDEEYGHFATEIMNLILFFEPDSIPTELFIRAIDDNSSFKSC